MAVISIGTLRYDIMSDTTSFVRGIKATRQQKKEADRVFREGLNPMQRHNMALMRMMGLYRKGMVTKKQVLAQQVKIKAKLREEQMQLRMNGVNLQKYAGSYSVASKKVLAHAAALDRNSKAALRNAAANRAAGSSNRLANFGGSMGSMLGFGGAGAGAGRIMGMGLMGGMGGAAFMGLGAGALIMKKMIDEARTLETALVDMQVILGDDRAGTVMINNLREIARTTPLTSKALIKGAQTMLGYGLSAEGLEDTMYRIGEIAGGDANRMQALTRAFSQIQSAGKLMGQELLQLINAGFPIAEIAKAAGVSMDDFRAAMERGEIKASHMTQAMINLTSAGGMMEGRLERQADTVNGKWITAVGSIEQKFAEMGEGNNSVLKDMIQNFGEFTVGFLGGLEDVFGAMGEFFSFMGMGWDEQTDRLDKHGKQLSFYAQSVRSFSDFFLRNVYGYTQAEIDAQRATERRFQMMSDAHTEEARKQKAVIDGRKTLEETVNKEVDAYAKAQDEKAKGIYKEMQGEEDLARMRARHKKERAAARREMTRIRAGAGNAAADKYFIATWKRQKAEEAQMLKKMREENAKAWAKQAKTGEDKRFEQEKKNIKKAAEIRKAEIQKEFEFRNDVAKNIADRGQMASTDDTYAAAAAIQRDFEQNTLVNKANDVREKQLNDLKNLEERAERNAERRHQQNLALIEQQSQKAAGKP